MHFHTPPDTILTGKSILNASRPGVYAWIREEKYLYIGQSARVLTRIAKHNIVNTPANPILPEDKIVIWYFKTQQEAMFKEMELIMEHLPIFNFPSVKEKFSDAKCLYCGKPFKLVRNWQKFCSKKCQTSNVIDYPEDIEEIDTNDPIGPLRPLEGYRAYSGPRFRKDGRPYEPKK